MNVTVLYFLYNFTLYINQEIYVRYLFTMFIMTFVLSTCLQCLSPRYFLFKSCYKIIKRFSDYCTGNFPSFIYIIFNYDIISSTIYSPYLHMFATCRLYIDTTPIQAYTCHKHIHTWSTSTGLKRQCSSVYTEPI